MLHPFIYRQMRRFLPHAFWCEKSYKTKPLGEGLENFIKNYDINQWINQLIIQFLCAKLVFLRTINYLKHL